MPKISRQVGSTSQIVEVVAQSTASSPPGLPLTGLAYNTASLTCYYKRNTGSGSVAVTLDAVSTLGTYEPSSNSHGAFLVVDATDMTGVYEFHLPNNALASGADTVTFCIQGATNLAPIFLEVELTAVSNQAADYGLSAATLPTAPTANTWGEALFFADLMGGRINTAQAGTSTTITLDSGASTDAGAYVGDDIYLYGGTGGGIRGSGQRRTITAYNTSTKVATVQRAWDTTPDSTSKFMTLPQPQANVGLWSGTAVGAYYGPFKVDTANGFSFRMVSSTDNKTAYTGGSVSGSRTIAGGSSNAVSGTITQIGSTSEYYFAGAAADFNGAEIHFAFTASGANPVYLTVNTTP